MTIKNMRPEEDLHPKRLIEAAKQLPEQERIGAEAVLNRMMTATAATFLLALLQAGIWLAPGFLLGEHIPANRIIGSAALVMGSVVAIGAATTIGILKGRRQHDERGAELIKRWWLPLAVLLWSTTRFIEGRLGIGFVDSVAPIATSLSSIVTIAVVRQQLEQMFPGGEA